MCFIQVGLCSDLPKPSQPAMPSVHKEASKVMTLSFPQAQRAELSTSTVHPTQDRINLGKSSHTLPVFIQNQIVA